jgi:molybdate transport system substrate-binding protein
VSAEDRHIIAHVGLGLGNRTGSPASDIWTAEKSRITLLGVDLIVFNRVESIEAFESALERLGIYLLR